MHKPLSLALFLLLFFCCALHAQKSKVNTDSPWGVYHDPSGDDEAKYDALRQIANAVRPDYPDSALKIADTMEVIALRQKDTSHLAWKGPLEQVDDVCIVGIRT